MSGMKDLFGDKPYNLPKPAKERAFGGETYEPEHDYVRLTGQLGRVFEFMKDGRWRSLESIVAATGGTTASVSARLRDLRKAKYGGHSVGRQRVKDGLFLYQLTVNTEAR